MEKLSDKITMENHKPCSCKRTEIEHYYVNLLKQLNVSIRLSEQEKAGQVLFLLKQWGNGLNECYELR